MGLATANLSQVQTFSGATSTAASLCSVDDQRCSIAAISSVLAAGLCPSTPVIPRSTAASLCSVVDQRCSIAAISSVLAAGLYPSTPVICSAMVVMSP